MVKLLDLPAGIVLIILFSITPVITSPMIHTGTIWTSDFRPHGGYVDEVLFVMYPSEDYHQVLNAVQRGEIDAYDETIPSKYLPGLLTNPNISVKIQPSTRYRQITLNCDRFPTNITGYRRALAYGMDKFKISMEVTGGAGKPLDSYIPLSATQWEIESSLTENFYEKDIAKGNASLEAAGFKDIDGDGWREYDVNNNGVWDLSTDIDDEKCAIELTAYKDYEAPNKTCQVAVDGLLEMGMRAEVVEASDLITNCRGIEKGLLDTEMQIKADGNIPNRITGCNCLGWDGWGMTFSWDVGVATPPDLLYYLFRTGQIYAEYLYYFSNATIDNALDEMMNANTLEEAKQKAAYAAALLVYEQPMIVCYNDIYINAYRINKFDGFFSFSGKGFTGANPYTCTKLHLKNNQGGPYGGTFRMAISDDFESKNILLATEHSTTIVMGYIYEGLWQIDPNTWDPIPGLAYNWTTEQVTGGQKFTFKLYENATWHDGKNVTSTDVKYTWENIWPSSPELNDILAHVYKVVAPDDYTVEIYSNKTGYFEWARATGAPVLPKHIWEKHGPDFDEWIPENSEMIGSGPYRWNAYTIDKEISLLRNDDWRWHVGEEKFTISKASTSTSLAKIDTIIIFSGLVAIVTVHFFRRRRT
ncbi:MAG: ABC transporter substrate-binding protein [Candidatus Hodarchaeota archaeon]